MTAVADEASPLNLANGLTALRIVLAPVFLLLYVEGDRLRALAAFAAAAATDVLDGLVARALRQHTRLGAFLDPIADKLLAACALVALALTVVVALAGDFGAYPRGEIGPFVVACALLAAQCVAISFVQYFLFFLRAVRSPA